LWRRIVFNISVSNTDDHLRNHGFLLSEEGWRLSPAFDVNPSIDKQGLALNIDMDNNALDYELARSYEISVITHHIYIMHEISYNRLLDCMITRLHDCTMK
jgi:Uncharacterized protein related to capsule biosynthesis enzymes